MDSADICIGCDHESNGCRRDPYDCELDIIAANYGCGWDEEDAE